MTRNGSLSGPIARVSDSVGRLFRLPAFVERRRMLVVPPPRRRSTPRRRVPRPWFLVAPLLLLLPVAASEEDSMLVDASGRATSGVSIATEVAGEVERRSIPARRAAERFVAWESQALGPGSSGAVGRSAVAEGIRLLAEVVQAAGTGANGSASSEALAAMQWHGARLAERPVDVQYGEYEDAGHAHAAFSHAARLLGALPDAPGGVTGELTRAAVALNARPLGAQGPEVRGFFNRAAAVLAATAAP